MSFSHLDESGNPNMEDVSEKQATKRIAKAQAIVVLNDDILQHLVNHDIQTKKGSVFQTAIIAGIMGAKKTGELIPLCHSLGLENCHITIQVSTKNEVIIHCTATITAKTGVEMEALMGASIAALTIYDMCKAFSHDILIKEIKLLEKRGGKSDFVRNP
ncbi:MAG: cyclic pyranopterin monophosphate synthase MoaC [Thermoflexibacter sp.]